MRRRKFIPLLASAAAAWPFAAGAQQTEKAPRIGMLLPGPPGSYPELDAFYQVLRELGYAKGQNIAIERVYADWKPDRFAELAAELVRRKVDIIVVASTSPARAAHKQPAQFLSSWPAWPTRSGTGSSPASRGRAETSRAILFLARS